jgi:hypothetical protein
VRAGFSVEELRGVLTVYNKKEGKKFFDDDPLWVERDHQNASGVQPWDIDLVVDLSYNLFGTLGDPATHTAMERFFDLGGQTADITGEDALAFARRKNHSEYH